MPAKFRDAGRCPDTVARGGNALRPAGRRSRASRFATVVQRAVQLLQRADTDVAANSGFDALDGGRGALDRRDAGNVDSDCGRADLVAVDAWSGVSVGRVEHHVDLAGADRIDRRHWRTTRLRFFEVLANLITRDTVAAQHLCGAFGGQHPEAE